MDKTATGKYLILFPAGGENVSATRVEYVLLLTAFPVYMTSINIILYVFC
jgi:hypothetical protein